jgi:hypothetical protein
MIKIIHKRQIMILNKINTMAVLIGFYLLCHMPRALAENSENNNGFHISGIRPYIFVLINNHYDKNTKISVPKKLKPKDISAVCFMRHLSNFQRQALSWD